MGWGGAVFDWDGVVIDSSTLHLNSWQALATELGLPLPCDHFEKGFGKRNQTIIPEIFKWTDDPHLIDQWGKRKEELYRQLGEKLGIPLATGSKEFLHLVHSARIKCSIGTSTEKKNVELALKQHQMSDFFIGAACSEDVSFGKPHPEVFLKAVNILALQPSECVVFEDSPHGIEAGKEAGMKTVALTTSHSTDKFCNLNPDLIVSNLGSLNLSMIENLFH